jgi:uncharacterized membrane protein
VDSAISFLVPCAIVAAASVPLVAGAVPPNRYYGFRTRRTMADRELWFRANRFAGWALLIASGASAGIYALHPEYASGRSFAGLVVLVVPLVVALAASFGYVRRVDGRGRT